MFSIRYWRISVTVGSGIARFNCTSIQLHSLTGIQWNFSISHSLSLFADKPWFLYPPFMTPVFPDLLFEFSSKPRSFPPISLPPSLSSSPSENDALASSCPRAGVFVNAIPASSRSILWCDTRRGDGSGRKRKQKRIHWKEDRKKENKREKKKEIMKNRKKKVSKKDKKNKDRNGIIEDM